jgi:uncharacterized protein (DUF58 family)
MRSAMRPPKDSRSSVRVTRFGALYIAAATICGLLGVYADNNLLCAIFGLMVGALAVSGWVSRASITALRPVGVEAGALFARLRGGIWLRLADGAPRRVRGLDVYLEIDGCRVGPAFFCGGGGLASPLVPLPVRPERRGGLKIGGVEFRTGYPFGLLTKTLRFPMDTAGALGARLAVAPHPAGAKEPDYGGGDDCLDPTPASGYSSPVGARPFRPGDPMGGVHWKRTAQRGEPMVRLMEGDEARGLALELDLGEWAPGQAFESELEEISGAVLQARLQKRDATLTIYGPDGRRDAVGHMAAWRALAEAEAYGDGR